MKVLLINICLRNDVSKILYPIGLGFVASAIERTRHELEIIDMDANRMSYGALEKILSEKEYDVLGMGCIVTGYTIIKKIAGISKRVNPGAAVVVGNSVASSIPDILLDKTDVDIAVIGEGDVTIVELLDCLEADGPLKAVKGICYRADARTVTTDTRPLINNLDDIPLQNWDLFDMEKYLSASKYNVSEPLPMPIDQIRAFAVNTARGCAFNCSFCYHVFKGQKYRYRSTETIVSEISTLQEKYAVNYINFWDELTLFSTKQTLELVTSIENSGGEFFWTASCRGNLFSEDDIDLLKRMKKAGCVGLGYSLESANKELLEKMNKKLDPEDFVRQKKALDKTGITTWTSLVIGFPGENEATIDETFDLCYQNDIFPSAGFLLPQPGTPIYQYAVQKGFIENEEKYFLDMGDRQDLRINLTEMPQEKLYECVRKNLMKIRDKLKLDISDQQLLKSGKYRAKKNAAS